MINRVIPGGLAKWFQAHEGTPRRKLPEILADTDLIDGEPFGLEVNERTLRDWQAKTPDARDDKEQQQ
ncbi:MAG: hypothetical protein ACRCW4_11435 [Candidatus Neomicrothrix subdominans]